MPFGHYNVIIQYVEFPGVDPDQTSLSISLPSGKPLALLVWVHGGGWTNGDRRRTRHMPNFCRDNNILFISINYPLTAAIDLSLIDLQLKALQAFDYWLSSNSYLSQFPEAFSNITLLSHSSGSHLVALKDKISEWNTSVANLILMDCAAYDLRARFYNARSQQQRSFSRLLRLDRHPPAMHDSILQSYSPALLPSNQRVNQSFKVLILTSPRPAAYYSAEKLNRSYSNEGCQVRCLKFAWEHEEFPEAVGVNPNLNKIILQALDCSLYA